MPSPFQELTLIGDSYFKLNKIIDVASLDSDQYSIRNIVSGDFDGNGLPDILLNSNDQKVQGAGGARTPAWLFLQNKIGDWVESEIVDFDMRSNTQFAAPVVVDFEGDGIDEIFFKETGAHLLEEGDEYGALDFLIKFDPSSGLIVNASHLLPQMSLLTHGFAAGDLNNDGITDIVVNDRTIKGTRLWAGSLEGGFTDVEGFAEIFGVTEAVSSGGSTYQLPEKHLSSLIYDFDNDGYNDLVLGQDSRLTGSRIYWGSASGFSESNYSTLPDSEAGPLQLVNMNFIDIDNDGFKDIVGSFVGENYSYCEIQVLKNTGARSFNNVTTDYIPAGQLEYAQDPFGRKSTHVSNVYVEDLNLDGLKDILLDTGGKGFDLLIATASGQFNIYRYEGFMVSYPADHDADGDMDILIVQHDAFQGTTADIFVLDNLQSNTVLYGTVSNDVIRQTSSKEVIDGNAGIDTVVYAGSKSHLEKSSSGYIVQGDTLIDIERIQFADTSIAIDLDGHSGFAVKALGAFLGAESLTPENVGIVLNLLDGGLSYEDLLSEANTAIFGSDPAGVDMVGHFYMNLFGEQAPEEILNTYGSLIDNGELSAVDLAKSVADSDANAENINLIGLSSTGIEFSLG